MTDIITSLGAQAPFIESIAVRYMDDYDTRPEECFSAGSRTIPKSGSWDDVPTYDADENEDGRIRGGTVTKTYRVNGRLTALCDRECDSVGRAGASQWARNFNSASAQKIIEGLDAIPGRYACNSPEIIQFENNLSRVGK